MVISAVSCTTSDPIERSILKNFEAGDIKTLFKVFHLVYKKEYVLNSEDGIRRYRTFKKNWRFILEENKKGHDYVLGLTPFVDYTEEELKALVNNKPGDIDASFDNLEHQEVEPVQKEIQNFFDLPDDEDEGKLLGRLSDTQVVRNPISWIGSFPPVRDQGTCGSCWTFSACGAMEANYNIQKKLATDPTFYLSPQQLVDCDTNSSGCNGGSYLSAFANYAKNTGLVHNSAYPYTYGSTGVTGTCKTSVVSNTSIPKYKLTTFQGCSDCTIDQYYTVLSRGPVSISCYADSRWFYYVSGIFSVSSCPYSASNHAIIAVGWGKALTTSGTVEFTTIRNSWGRFWGESGYMRVRYQPDMNKSCFVNKRAYRPIF